MVRPVGVSPVKSLLTLAAPGPPGNPEYPRFVLGVSPGSGLGRTWGQALSSTVRTSLACTNASSTTWPRPGPVGTSTTPADAVMGGVTTSRS